MKLIYKSKPWFPFEVDNDDHYTMWGYIDEYGHTFNFLANDMLVKICSDCLCVNYDTYICEYGKTYVFKCDKYDFLCCDKLRTMFEIYL